MLQVLGEKIRQGRIQALIDTRRPWTTAEHDEWVAFGCLPIWSEVPSGGERVVKSEKHGEIILVLCPGCETRWIGKHVRLCWPCRVKETK